MRNKIQMKGISPLIAAVLLIAITVAIATLVTGFVSSLTRSAQVAVENKTVEAVDCASASISIDQVYFSVAATTADRGNISRAIVVVRNSGQIDDIQINNVTVINSTGSVFSFGTTAPVLTNFDRGVAYSFVISTVAGGSPIGRTCPADFSKAIATTTCGGVSAVFDKSPVCS